MSDKIEDNPLVQIDVIERNADWLKEWDDFLADPEFNEVMNKALKIIANPNVPQPKVATLCVQLEGYAAVFRLRFVEYMGWRKGTKEATAKKNAYKEMYYAIDNLVSSLKYLIRQ